MPDAHKSDIVIGMTVGLVIPGVETVHPHEEWNTSGYPLVGSFPYQPNKIWRPVIHYSAAVNVPDGDLREHDNQIGPWLSAIQRDYVTNRKYSFGYAWAIDWLGGVWEGRGFNYRAAANADHNTYTAPILFITDRDDPGSELMWQSARAVWREHRRRANRNDFESRPHGHGELYLETGQGTPTACPGTALLAQRNIGLGDLDYDTGDPIMPAPSPLIGGPKRAFDSRPNETPDPPYDQANAAVPRTKVWPGQPRQIFVGLATTAEIHLTVVNANGPGHAEISQSPTSPRTSLVNYSPIDPSPRSGTGEVALDAGTVWIHTFVNAADVIVDVRGLG